MSDHMAVRWTLGSYWGMLMPSLAWLECVSTSWMIKWLMPSVGPPVPLTWIQCGIIYNCSHYRITHSQELTDSLIQVWDEIPGTGYIRSSGVCSDGVESIPRHRAIHPRVRQMSCWENWVWFWIQSSGTFVQGHPYSFSIIICYGPVIHMLCLCILLNCGLICHFVSLTGCGLMSWSASGHLYRTFPAGKWWVLLFIG